MWRLSLDSSQTECFVDGLPFPSSTAPSCNPRSRSVRLHFSLWKYTSGKREKYRLKTRSTLQVNIKCVLKLLVEALRYKLEVRGFDLQWGHWDVLLYESTLPEYGPGVDTATNRTEHQVHVLWDKGGRCVELTTLILSCADYLEIVASSNSWSPQGLSQLVMRCQIEYLQRGC
jgi:hypothetical protein